MCFGMQHDKVIALGVENSNDGMESRTEDRGAKARKPGFWPLTIKHGCALMESWIAP